MKKLAFARLRTIVRLGKTVPMVFFASAVDFILPVNCARNRDVRNRLAEALNIEASSSEPRASSNIGMSGAEALCLAKASSFIL